MHACTQIPNDARVTAAPHHWRILNLLLGAIASPEEEANFHVEQVVSKIICLIQNKPSTTYSTQERRALRESPDIRARMRDYVRLRCPICGGQPLHFAVVKDLTFVVEELLFWGADPNSGAPKCQQECLDLGQKGFDFQVFFPHEQGLSSIWLAVAMQFPGVVRLLIQDVDSINTNCLARKTDDLGEGLTDRNPAYNYMDANLADLAILEPAPHACMNSLILKGFKLPLIAFTMFIIQARGGATQHIIEAILEAKAISWQPESVRLISLAVSTIMHPLRDPAQLTPDQRRRLFSIPTDPDQPAEYLFKLLVVQTLLVELCTARFSPTSLSQENAIQRLQWHVDTLCSAGASPLGWSASHFKMVRERMLQELIPLQGRQTRYWRHGIPTLSWCTFSVICGRCRLAAGFSLEEDVPPPISRRPVKPTDISLYCMMPLAIRMAACDGNVDDPLVKVLANITNVPWLRRLEDIPCANRKLHNGPTCNHANLTEHQKKISLVKLSSSQVIPTLQAAAHRVIERNWARCSGLMMSNLLDEPHSIHNWNARRNIFRRSRRVYDLSGGIRTVERYRRY